MKIKKSIYESVVREFGELPAQKAHLDELQKRYRSKANTPIEDRLPYTSSSYYELDVRIQKSPSLLAPQDRATMALDSLAEEILQLAGEIADKEEVLNYAIDKAVGKSYQQMMRKKIRTALKAHLYYRMPVEDIDINKTTLKKYKDYAVHIAAENLGYL